MRAISSLLALTALVAQHGSHAVCTAPAAVSDEGGVNFRATPDVKGEKLNFLKERTAVDIQCLTYAGGLPDRPEADSWYQVIWTREDNGEVVLGYVHASFVTPTTDHDIETCVVPTPVE